MTKSIIYQCLKEGDFILHSGQKSKYLFDTMELIRNEDFLEEFYEFIGNDFVVGIEFGGAILAAMNSGYQGKFAVIRKDGTIYGSLIPKKFVLLDDVVTTENSIRTAAKLLSNIGHCYNKVKCIVDRRNKENKLLHIESMLECNK